MSVHEWVMVGFTAGGTVMAAGAVAYMARQATLTAMRNSRAISNLRERVAAVEALLGIPRQHRG